MTSLTSDAPLRLTLDALRATLRRDTHAYPHLGALRDFNHFLVGELGKCLPLSGRALLDLGASVHGYALEAALEQGVAHYEGIDLDVARHWGASRIEVAAPEGCTGCLRQMNAETLDFADGTFDCLLSISTFEHFHRPDVVLAEMFRVLRTGGVALVSFEPIWTASYGHHLHHFGEISGLVPPWGHLYLSRDQMRDELERQIWPVGAPLTRDEALSWMYDGDAINRHDIRALKSSFAASPFETEWLVPLADQSAAKHAAVADYLARVLPYSAEELLVRGLSLLLRKS